jgi:hypothetical protein
MTRIGAAWLCAVVFAVSFASAGAAAVNVKDAVGIWLFDENRGVTAEDSSPNGNDGELTKDGGKLPQWVDGEFGTALELDGSGAYVDLGTEPAFELDGGLTITAWINVAGPGVGNGIVLIKEEPPGTPGASYGIVYLVGTQKLSLSMQTDAAGWRDYLTVEPVDTDTWYHFAGAYEPGELNLYLDGELNETYDVSGDIDPSDGPLYIGREDAWAKEHFSGIVDEVAIFDFGLSQDDVKDIMNTGLAGLLAVSASGKLSTTWADIKAQAR